MKCLKMPPGRPSRQPGRQPNWNRVRVNGTASDWAGIAVAAALAAAAAAAGCGANALITAAKDALPGT